MGAHRFVPVKKARRRLSDGWWLAGFILGVLIGGWGFMAAVLYFFVN